MHIYYQAGTLFKRNLNIYTNQLRTNSSILTIGHRSKEKILYHQQGKNTPWSQYFKISLFLQNETNLRSYRNSIPPQWNSKFSIGSKGLLCGNLIIFYTLKWSETVFNIPPDSIQFSKVIWTNKKSVPGLQKIIYD